MQQSGEKTEKPTARRLLKARREGQYASSRDFVGGLQFMVFTILLVQYGPKLWTGMRESTRMLITEAFQPDLGPLALVGILHQAFSWGLYPLLGASAILVATGLAFQLGSTNFAMSLKRLAPKTSNFSVISKLKSAPQKGFASAIQAIALLGVFGFTIYWVATKDGARLLLSPLSSLRVGLDTVRAICIDVMWKATAFFLLAGMIDLFRQKRSFIKQMRMSKHELREELKESEGNPQIKMRIRRLQKDARRRRMMEDVKTATAVIVNPTHFAVAIRYHHESMPAPIVVAKGKNYLAQRIRARALENQIPLIENPPLAQALYKSVDVGQQIPAHLYRAVAEILAYVYRLMGTKKFK
jgi:flagellar biosynthesis protein FlhB